MLKLLTMRLTTFSLWALAAGSAAFWILHGVSVASDSATARTQPQLSSAQIQSQGRLADHSQALTPQVAAALGAKNPIVQSAASTQAANQARFQLVGVLALGSKNGAALIAVDGKPAKPYRIGAAIEEGLEVTAVAPRSVSIGSSGTAAFTLELPLQK